jgi:L-rhamnose-H+ transport protein
MIMLVLFSNVLAVLFKEWKGCSPRTRLIVAAGLAVLCGAIVMLTYGNHMGEAVRVSSVCDLSAPIHA